MFDEIPTHNPYSPNILMYFTRRISKYELNTTSAMARPNGLAMVQPTRSCKSGKFCRIQLRMFLRMVGEYRPRLNILKNAEFSNCCLIYRGLKYQYYLFHVQNGFKPTRRVNTSTIYIYILDYTHNLVVSRSTADHISKPMFYGLILLYINHSIVSATQNVWSTSFLSFAISSIF